MNELNILIGTILLYLSAFGFSDYFIKKYKLDGKSYLIYYTIILSIGLYMVLPEIIYKL